MNKIEVSSRVIYNMNNFLKCRKATEISNAPCINSVWIKNVKQKSGGGFFKKSISPVL